MSEEETEKSGWMTGVTIVLLGLQIGLTAVPAVIGILDDNLTFDPDGMMLVAIIVLLFTTSIIGIISFGFSAGAWGGPNCMSKSKKELSSTQYRFYITFNIFIFFCLIAGIILMAAGKTIPGTVGMGAVGIQVPSPKFENPYIFGGIVLTIFMIFGTWITNTTFLNNCWGQSQCADGEKCCNNSKCCTGIQYCQDPPTDPNCDDLCDDLCDWGTHVYDGNSCVIKDGPPNEPEPTTTGNKKDIFEIVCKTNKNKEDCEDNKDNKDCIWCDEGTKQEGNCINRSSSNSNTNEEICNQGVSEEKEPGNSVTGISTFLGKRNSNEKCIKISDDFTKKIQSLDTDEPGEYEKLIEKLNPDYEAKCNEINGCNWNDNMCIEEKWMDTGAAKEYARKYADKTKESARKYADKAKERFGSAYDDAKGSFGSAYDDAKGSFGDWWGSDEEGFALLQDSEQLFSKKMNIKSNYKDVGNESYKSDTLMNNLENYLMNEIN
jgi:hypothetical protein